MNYGISYMGSKSKICKDICSIFPPADNFYDLFGGGFSVTHYMLLNRYQEFKNFHFNEIIPGIPNLIKDAIDGKYNYNTFLPKWISKKEFDLKKGIDPYIKTCWSFGNDGRSYLFNKTNEIIKESLHNAVVFNEFDDLSKYILRINHFSEDMLIKDRRLFTRKKNRGNNNKDDYISNINKLVNEKIITKQLELLEPLEKLKDYQLQQPEGLERLRQLEGLERLEQFERIERLQQLELVKQSHNFNKLNFYNTSYENIEIKENSIIYCDIPYESTKKYDKKILFDKSRFLDYANSQVNPVFISEYQINDSRFTEIFSIKKRVNLNSDKKTNLIREEKLFVNKSGLEYLQNLKIIK